MKRLFAFFITLLMVGAAFGQNPLKPSDLVLHHKAANGRFAPVTDLLTASQTPISARPDIAAELSKGVVLDFNFEKAQRMGGNTPKTLTLTLPTEGNTTLDIELVKVNIFSPDFVVNTTEGPLLAEDLGTHYRGVIKGKNGSIAAVSMYEDHIVGFFSAPGEGNLVLAPLKNSTDQEHVLYNDANLRDNNTWGCDTEDDGAGYTDDQLAHHPEKALSDCIRIYYEVDYDIYQDKGSTTTAFVTAEFNEIATIYANESLNYLLNEVYINTTSGSAYTAGNSSSLLSQFKSRISTINGANLGHLITYRSSGGVAAGFSGLCNSNVDNSLCISSINGTYSAVPTYSWDIMVQTHEMGHLNGSRHTHACVWNGNNTAIDGCAGGTEGGCALPGFPSGGGTMMSYCHIQSVGINFSNGFGSQPGDVIRNATTNASCLQACGPGGGGNECTTTITSYPYNEDYESSITWTQSSADDFDWSRNSGGTPSNNTGPTAAAQGTYYAYMEVSSPNYPSKAAILNSPCFDLTSVTNPEVSFQYHASGANVGTLRLEASTDGSSWTQIWSFTGDQGTNWASATVSLNGYTNEAELRLRFNGTSGSNWDGDMCVDDLSVAAAGGGGGPTACTGGINSFPYSESFESGLGAWNQDGPDDFDWTRDSGGTPSSNTGPSSGSDGSWYVYCESSTPNYSSKTALLTSDCFDLSNETQANFTFDYHMYGAAAMGGLVLSVSDDNGTSWTAVWSETGNQGNSWQSASVNLDAYAGGSIQLRFTGTTGTTWQGDMAVDNVGLSTSGGGGGCVDVTVTINTDNYASETTWSITDGSGNSVASGGPYSTNNSTETATVCLDASGCNYTFTINDSYGDGICCGYGNGSYTVTSASGTYASGGEFTSTESTSFCPNGSSLPQAGNSDTQAAIVDALSGLEVYPNPTNGDLNLRFKGKGQADAIVRLVDIMGKTVHTENMSLFSDGIQKHKLNVKALPQGTYLVRVELGNQMLNARFVVSK